MNIDFTNPNIKTLIALRHAMARTDGSLHFYGIIQCALFSEFLRNIGCPEIETIISPSIKRTAATAHAISRGAGTARLAHNGRAINNLAVSNMLNYNTRHAMGKSCTSAIIVSGDALHKYVGGYNKFSPSKESSAEFKPLDGFIIQANAWDDIWNLNGENHRIKSDDIVSFLDNQFPEIITDTMDLMTQYDQPRGDDSRMLMIVKAMKEMRYMKNIKFAAQHAFQIESK